MIWIETPVTAWAKKYHAWRRTHSAFSIHMPMITIDHTPWMCDVRKWRKARIVARINKN